MPASESRAAHLARAPDSERLHDVVHLEIGCQHVSHGVAQVAHVRRWRTCQMSHSLLAPLHRLAAGESFEGLGPTDSIVRHCTALPVRALMLLPVVHPFVRQRPRPRGSSTAKWRPTRVAVPPGT